MKAEQEIVRKALSRRDALRIGIAAASCLAASGCSVFGGDSPSEFEAARHELFRTLDGLGRSDIQQVRLMTIARRIASEAAMMLDEQAAFLSDFDRLSRRTNVSDSDLLELADAFSVRRVRLRDDLFRLQDQLRAELSADEWTEVVAALNKKAHANRFDLSGT